MGRIRGWAIIVGLLCFVAIAVPTIAPYRAGSPPLRQPVGVDPQRTPTGGDPIYMSGGQFRESWGLLSLGGPIPVDFTLIYAPDLVRKSPSNDGRTQFPPWIWMASFTSNTVARCTVSLDTGAEPPVRYVNVFVSDDTFVFREDQGVFHPVGPDRYALRMTEEWLYMMDPIRGRVSVFRTRTVGWQNGDDFIERIGELAAVLDRNGNSLIYTYNEDNNPTRIEDGLGRSLDLTYIESSLIGERHLSRVTDGYGRSIDFHYEPCPNHDQPYLASFTDPLGRTTAFEYDLAANDECELLGRIVRPRGNSHVNQTWGLNPKGLYAIATQQDSGGNQTSLEYGLDPQQNITTNLIRPDGGESSFTCVLERYPLEIRDEEGKFVAMGYDSGLEVTSVTDRLGGVTHLAMDPGSGDFSSITNVLGHTVSYSYTPQDQTFANPFTKEEVTFTFNNRTRADYPDGTFESFGFDARGNLVSATDRNGKPWLYTVNAAGQVTELANPRVGTITFTYNPDGTPASRRDSETGTTLYEYDALKRMTGIVHPGGASLGIAYDAADQVTSVTDERGNVFTFTYDPNGNRVKVTDHMGNEKSYTVDDMDRVASIVDPLGHAALFTYDPMGRLFDVTDPNGNTVGYRYDIVGRLVRMLDGEGFAWRYAYDEEGTLTEETTPLGRTTTYVLNANGWPTSILDAAGEPSLLAYDSHGRTRTMADRVGRQVAYDYDANGLIAGITKGVQGATTYARDDNGHATGITDFLGNLWSYSYTPMGRLEEYADPMGNRTGYTYDEMGRLSQMDYPTGETLEVVYDDLGRKTACKYSDQTRFDYSYDTLGRCAASKHIAIAYDDRDNVIETGTPPFDFGATWDAGGRLKTVSYPLDQAEGKADGRLTVTYEYDARNLLTRVEDDLTGAWVALAYDGDGDLASIQRSNGVSTTLERDPVGRVVRIRDQGTAVQLDQHYTLNAEGQAVGLQIDGLLEPSGLLEERGDVFTYDAANRIDSAGYAADARGRVTSLAGSNVAWNGPGMVISAMGKALSYNGFGDPAQLWDGTADTELFYNYALARTPVVAERDTGTGNFQRYYVWAPDGTLLYGIDAAGGNAPFFYHFDRIGSTVALTGGGGSVADRYAFTPYGELLAHEGGNPQPFTFTGRFGVRRMGEGLYLMGSRHYDARTARFLSPDRAGVSVYDGDSLNLYQYCSQDPVNLVDPFGTRGWNADRTVYTSSSGRFVQTSPPRPGHLGGWTFVPNPRPRENPPPPDPQPPDREEAVDEPRRPPEQPVEVPRDQPAKEVARIDPGRDPLPQGDAPPAPPPPPDISGNGDRPGGGSESSRSTTIGGVYGIPEMDVRPLGRAALNMARNTGIQWVRSLVPGAFGKGLGTTFRLAGTAQGVLSAGREMTVTVNALVEQRERIRRDTGIDTSDVYPGRRDLAEAATAVERYLPFLFW